MRALAGRFDIDARRGRSSLLWMLVPIVAAMMLSGSASATQAVFWCYPIIVLLHLRLSAGAAGAGSVVLLASAAKATIRAAGFDAALPLAASLGFVIILMMKMLQTVGALQRTLEDEAITDPLTGAFNRRHLDVCLAMAIERRRRTAEPASLLLFDIDHFKQVNDRLGHAAGDEVLRALVRLVGGRMRTIDALFRLGGEEFALLLTDARYADALVVAEDLRSLVAESSLLDSHRISISVGVSELQKGQSACVWLAETDAALYRAKRDGRNRVAGRALATAS